MFISDNNYYRAVEILLNEGAIPNIQANDGLTALIFASRNGHTTWLKFY